MAKQTKSMEGVECRCGYSDCVLRILDSGASYHMDPSRKDFLKLDEIKKMEISTAGKPIQINHQGTLTLELIHNDGEITPVTLGDTLYHASLEMGLISVRRLTERGFSVIFLNKCAVIKKDGQTMYVAECRNGIYYMHTRSQNKSGSRMVMSATETWHRRFGHPGKDVLAKMKQN
jgi:hypothetical protein